MFTCCCLVCSLHQPARICLVVVSIIGFIGFDMAYTAVVLNYSIECQLMIYYLKNICQRILSKEWAIDEAIRVSCAWIVIQCTREVSSAFTAELLILSFSHRRSTTLVSFCPPWTGTCPELCPSCCFSSSPCLLCVSTTHYSYILHLQVFWQLTTNMCCYVARTSSTCYFNVTIKTMYWVCIFHFKLASLFCPHSGCWSATAQSVSA